MRGTTAFAILLALAGCAAQTQTVDRPQGLPAAPGLRAAPD
jgi:hypothetical protein